MTLDSATPLKTVTRLLTALSIALMTSRFSAAVRDWFSPREPRKIKPLMPDAMRASAWRAVASRSSEPSFFIWVVIAGNTPLQNGFFMGGYDCEKVGGVESEGAGWGFREGLLDLFA